MIAGYYRFQCCTCCPIWCAKVVGSTTRQRWPSWKSTKSSYSTPSSTSKWLPFAFSLSNWHTTRGTISVTASYLGSPPSCSNRQQQKIHPNKMENFGKKKTKTKINAHMIMMMVVSNILHDV